MLHHDETGLRVAGAEGARREWTHVTCTSTLTHYARHTARGATALEAIGILPGYGGVSVHDGWTSYRHFHTARHALCNAHHLRELTFVHEELQQAWAGKLKELLREMRMAVDHARARGASCLQRAVRDDFIRHYEAPLGEGLAQKSLAPTCGHTTTRSAQAESSAQPPRPAVDLRTRGALVPRRLHRALRQQPGGTRSAHGQSPAEDLRHVLQRCRRGRLLPHSLGLLGLLDLAQAGSLRPRRPHPGLRRSPA